MTPPRQQQIIIFALRYALQDCSEESAGPVCDEIMAMWPQFDRNTKEVIKADICGAVETGCTPPGPWVQVLHKG